MACIPKHLLKEFDKRRRAGEITPDKLIAMGSSEARREYFASFLGEENAKRINDSFEQMVMKDGIRIGATKWAGNIKEQKQRERVLTKIGQVSEVLNPKDARPFFEDLVKQKVGVAVSDNDVAELSAFAKDYANSEKDIAALFNGGKYSIQDETAEGLTRRLKYGYARIAYEDYVNGLKSKAENKPIKEYLRPENYGEAIVNVAGFAKALKASLDNSVIGRQGLKTLITQPDIWAKNSAQSFKDFYTSMTGTKDALKAVRAEVLSRPNALNGLYKRENLAVGVQEESYPTSVQENIPVLGGIFKGSQDAFTAWQYRTRADVFDRLVDVANKSGADTKGLGILVNSLTGRGDISKYGAEGRAGKIMNNIFFSPRFVQSNIDALSAHAQDRGQMAKFAKDVAVANTVKYVLAITAVMGIVKAVAGAFGEDEAIEFDPRSSDFGKIRIGDTRFDISGGMASVATLASRLLTLSSKSASTGLVTPLNEERFGAKTGWDVLASFFEGKMSPAASVVKDLLKGKTFEGGKPTLVGEMKNLLLPLPISNYMEMSDSKDSAPILVAMLADAVGIGTNTYGTDVDWSAKAGLEMLQFREKVGEERFKQANDEFNDRYAEWFDRAKTQGRYNELSDKDKGQVLSRKRTEIKEEVFKRYGFKYKPSKRELPKIR